MLLSYLTVIGWLLLAYTVALLSFARRRGLTTVVFCAAAGLAFRMIDLGWRP